MVDINTFLLMMLYVLGSILLVVLIILSIKLIITINKIDNVVDDINGKVNKLNGLFSIIDVTTDKLAVVSDKLVDGVSFVVKKLFIRNKKDKGQFPNFCKTIFHSSFLFQPKTKIKKQSSFLCLLLTL